MSTVKVENEIITGNLTYHGILLSYLNYNVTNINSNNYVINSVTQNQINFFQCDTSLSGLNSNITITLPLITSTEMIICIVDIGGYVNINPIIIQTSGSNKICGLSSILLDGNYNVLRFTSNLSSIWFPV